jgi:hypothetical protein
LRANTLAPHGGTLIWDLSTKINSAEGPERLESQRNPYNRAEVIRWQNARTISGRKSGRGKYRLPFEKKRERERENARVRVVFRHPVGARVTSADDDEDVPRQGDAPKIHGDGGLSPRVTFSSAGKRRARRADNNRASETTRSRDRSLARSLVRERRLTQVGG